MEQLKTLQEDFNSMEQRLTEMEDKIDSINEKVTQVVDAIVGNRLTKQGGFISEVNELKEKIIHLESDIKKIEAKQDKYDLFKNRIIWTISILTAVGVAAKYIIDVYFTVKK